MIKRDDIRTLLTATMLILCILLIGVGASGLYGIRLTDAALEDASGNVPTVIAITQQQEASPRAHLRLYRLVTQKDGIYIQAGWCKSTNYVGIGQGMD